MGFKNISDKNPVAVIGAGSFGTAVANLLAENGEVLFYSRRPEAVEIINTERVNNGQSIHPNIRATCDMQELTDKCYLIFPSVSSDGFRQVMQNMAPYLRPDHMMIHCTKGFDIKLEKDKTILDKDVLLKPADIYTMSKVILEETCVKRVGCMSGPNLAREIANLQPAATVIASKFDEVIREGENAIRSKRLQVYSNHDIYSVELAGVMKNSMALAAGALGGLGYGQNAMAFLITRGLGEIIRLTSAMGANKQAFLGLAGIGDLVATCTSPMSRNYTVGARLAKGETLEQIIATSSEVAEGIKTVSISKKLADSTGIKVPIIQTIYKVLFEELNVEEALGFLMEYRWGFDADYM
ncbi:MAG: NAD(P)-dependent glycerol-3-phosphate dehydrogenase [Chitinophagales bacterium]|nr:NAD(P)-dependent glycerol-3-phosphate dehydrogenase [Chitinophagales bacterium]HMV13825.1 NAD(P)H-dependent glycerol-3-phosphate dehydrogenase [Chitinophagales bacterium]HMW12376.1 NAD(P)H-dependent glycerol-3-phosphate dehydrogenase [Chitinophagales bacterium]HMX60067.1 NAD(P)H-dependent glycerol-3-phosphate dehydrogenase [Chitinophagales bacterium]HMY23677.1 NAD(P)H-dependent glycerol-3-phosphate dehydrogenase [Chitinophagales bacterium]